MKTEGKRFSGRPSVSGVSPASGWQGGIPTGAAKGVSAPRTPPLCRAARGRRARAPGPPRRPRCADANPCPGAQFSSLVSTLRCRSGTGPLGWLQSARETARPQRGPSAGLDAGGARPPRRPLGCLLGGSCKRETESHRVQPAQAHVSSDVVGGRPVGRLARTAHLQAPPRDVPGQPPGHAEGQSATSMLPLKVQCLPCDRERITGISARL